jgi:hypothetical protein
MNRIWLDLFQDRDTGEVAILPRAILGDREGRFGDAVSMSESAFRTRGLAAVRDAINSARTDPAVCSRWTVDNRFLWDMHAKKPRTIMLEPHSSGDRAAASILHYDNAEVATPCHLGEDVDILLEGDPSDFAHVVLAALAMSKDFIWLSHDLVGLNAFFCLYSHCETGHIYWFDWVRVSLPAPHGDAMTAWGRHRTFQENELRPKFRQLMAQSLGEFAGRREDANPVPNPRGSQVQDAGVSAQRRVVIYQGGDTNSVLFRAYNFDTATDKQEESGIEACARTSDSNEILYETYKNLLEHVRVE